MNAPNYARLKGPGDFDAPAELEGEPGRIWGDLNEVEQALADSNFFAELCAEYMAEYLIGPHDTYAEAKLMRQMRSLAQHCQQYIDDMEAGK